MRQAKRGVGVFGVALALSGVLVAIMAGAPDAGTKKRAARVLEITGTPVDIRHMQSVFWSFVDNDTKLHTAQYLNHTGKITEKDFNELKTKVLEFCNMVDNPIKEDLKAVFLLKINQPRRRSNLKSGPKNGQK